MHSLNRGVAVTMIVALTAGRARAQVPVGADTLSAKSIAESIAVLGRLDDAVRKNKNDAASIYRTGMIAWALSLRAQAKPPAGGLNQLKYNRMADTSLRLAAEIEPKSPKYQLAAGLFLRYATDPTARIAAVAFLDAAADAARADADPAIRATAMLEAGRIHWLRYDSEANRRNYTYYPPMHPNEPRSPTCPWGMPASLDERIGDMPPSGGSEPPQFSPNVPGVLKILHDQLIECTQYTVGAGGADYAKAEPLFREATNAAPTDSRAFRQFAMLLAEKDRWRELEIAARARTKSAPTDANAWLALGLALHRSHKSDEANAVFDTALTRLSAEERGRLFLFTRLMNAKDSAIYAKSPVSARDRTEQSFWQMSDPLWSRPGDEPRTEFLARVVFAELRWTVEELGVRGADSDRGEIYVRYGPPDSIAVLRGGDYTASGGTSQSGSAFSPGGPGSTLGKPSQSDVITFWDYRSGLFIAFWGAPTYGTAHFPPADRGHVAEIVETRPASFDNVVTGRIDVIPLRTARFRAPADSIDVLFLTQAPVKAIRAGTAANAPVREDTWLFGRDVPNAYRDSLTLDATGLNARTYRLPPSAYMYRIEATADGASIAGRSTAWVTANNDTLTGFTLRGFGISDLLVATKVESNKNPPARWRDFDLTPLLGALPRQSNLELIWENYEFGQRAGQAQYQITLTIQKQRSAAGRVAAQIIGAVAGAVGVNRRDDRVVLQFDRSTAFAPTFVDHVTVGLADTPAGSYRVLLEITDRVTGRKTNRATEITIQ